MELRPYQNEFVAGVAKGFTEGHMRQLGVLPTGGGKCLGRGTPVMLFSGKVIPVEEVQIGDMLMGPGSHPRKVLSLARGREEMFQITPKKGDSYTVNGSHILSLRITGNKGRTVCAGRSFEPGEIANVSISDYLSGSSTFRHCAKGWRVGVDFEFTKTPKEISPYILGVWLGAGCSHLPSFANTDQAIISEINWHALSLGMNMREDRAEGKCAIFHITHGRQRGGRGKEYNPVTKALRAMGVLKNKHIPDLYKLNSREVRLQVLAGIIDTDGSLGHCGFDYISKVERLADDVVFLARSLGLAAYKKQCQKTCGNNGKVGTYYRVSISGDVNEVPCRVKRKRPPERLQKKNVLNTGIKVEPIGLGDYFGFEIDGDRLFLLGDFTVTHNTICFANIANRFHTKRGERTLVLAHREELIEQAADKIARSTGLIASIEKAERRADRSAPVVVASIQTMQGDRLATWEKNHFGLIVCDEAHHALADQWQATLNHFDTRVLGVTATPDRGDKRNLAVYFQNLAYECTLFDLIAQQYLSPILIRSVPLKIDLNAVKMTSGDYDSNGLDAAITPYLKEIARYLAENCADRKKIVVFLPLITTSKRFVEECIAAGVTARHVDGMSPDRKEILTSFGRGDFTVISNAMLLTEGWDEPGVDCVVYLRPTKSRSLYAQAVGRGTRLCEGKKNMLLLDFLWLHERHDLAKPASLVAKDKKEEEGITEALMSHEERDLSEAVEDAANEREAALIRLIAENAAKSERFLPIEQVGALLKDKKIREYSPVFGWETAPVTEGQKKVLDRFGLRCQTKGEASLVIGRLFERSRDKLATVRQLMWLVRMKHPSPETATAKEAKAFLDEKWGKKPA